MLVSVMRGDRPGLYTFTPASVNDAKVDPMAPMHLSHRKIMNLSARGGLLSAFSETDLHVLVHARIWGFEGLKFPFSWKRSCFVRSSVFFDTCVLAALCVSSFILKNSPAVWVVFPYWRCSPCTCGQRPSHQLSSIAVLSQWPLLQLRISFVCS